MQIKPGEIVYERIDEDNFLIWRLVSAKGSIKTLTKTQEYLKTQMLHSPKKLNSDGCTPEQRVAIIEYNKNKQGPVIRLKREIVEIDEKLKAILELRPPRR